MGKHKELDIIFQNSVSIKDIYTEDFLALDVIKLKDGKVIGIDEYTGELRVVVYESEKEFLDTISGA